MAIFAKKKDGRRERQGGAAAEGEAAKESVAIEVPDRHAENDGVLTKANIPEAATANDAGPVSDEPAQAEAKDASVDVDVEVAAPKADAGAAVATGAPTAAGDAEPIEPVDIEPEVIEAPAEAPLVFGIADAIKLMRSLPADPNIDLVVRVVRVTLGAVNVSVDDIMRDAEKKEKKVRESIAVLESEVADLEKSLHEKRTAIAAHQADLRETATVRERLHMADKYTPHPPPLPPGAARIPLPKPREWESFDSDIPLKDT